MRAPTIRTAAENAITQSDAFTDLMAASFDSVWILDVDNNILAANPIASQLMGMDAANPGRKPQPIFNHILKQDHGAIRAAREIAGSRNTEDYPLQCRFVSADFSIRDTRIILKKSSIDSEVVYILIAQDITSSAQSTLHAKRTRDELQIQRTEFHEVLSAAVHDLKAPVRHILTHIDAAFDLHDGDWRTIEKEAVIITQSGKRLLAILQALNEYNFVSNHPPAADAVPIESVVKSIASQLSLEMAGLAPQFDYEDLPLVSGDRKMLNILFQKLIGNAVTYRSDDHPKITISAERTDTELHIVIADNGIGIAPRFSDMIFKPFKRLHCHDDIPGTGLGLTICSKIMAAHAGSLSLDPNLDDSAGARFRLTFPLD